MIIITNETVENTHRKSQSKQTKINYLKYTTGTTQSINWSAETKIVQKPS